MPRFGTYDDASSLGGSDTFLIKQGASTKEITATIAADFFGTGSSGSVITPETYGAVGDGTTDDTDALEDAITALSSGDTLLLGSGKTYRHIRTLIFDKTDCTISGYGSVLLSTVETLAALRITGTNNTVLGLTHTHNNVTDRGSQDQDEAGFYISGTGHYLKDCVANFCRTVGFFCLDLQHYVLEDCVAYRTRADSFHNTFECSYGKIIRPIASYCGDDGVAIVSYNTGQAKSHHIEVISPRIYNQLGGRGLTVVGGDDITFTDVYVLNSYGAALYFANEASFSSWDTNNIRVTGGTINGSNTATALDHGAVLIFNSVNGSSLDDVTIEGLEIRNTRVGAGGSLQLKKGGSTGTMSGIVFKDIKLLGDKPYTDYSADGGLSATLTNIIHGEGVKTNNFYSSDHTLDMTDFSAIVMMYSTGSLILTIPPNSSVAFPLHTLIPVMRNNTGSVTITAGSGVTIHYKPNMTGNPAINAVYGKAECWKTGTDEWTIFGDV